ncbi:MAG TPA: acetolactate decarboxylase [Kofleriaceae bacterium]|nr:acetolactate decarboxylase [Kofleriaceae bacterium]
MNEHTRWTAGAELAATMLAAGCHATPVAAPATATATLVNASVRAAYLAGVYDGFLPVGALRARGDFGLGAADRNDGELVMLDGRCYAARGDGTVVELADDAPVPFASVTRFRPERRLHVTGPLPRAEFEARLDAWLPGPNRMFALRVHGRFARVVAGASDAQTPPYRPFPEVYREYHLIPRDGVHGTLVGFRMPPVLRDVSKQGYHFHLLSDDRKAGGHVDDEVIEDVEVEAEELHAVEILLPDSAAFQGAGLVLLGGPAR